MANKKLKKFLIEIGLTEDEAVEEVKRFEEESQDVSKFLETLSVNELEEFSKELLKSLPKEGLEH